MRLQDLIRTRKRLLSLTQEDLVARADTAGHPVSRGAWHRWTNEEPGSFPEPRLVQGMAAALQVSTRTVLDAAAESVGLRIHVDDTTHIEIIRSMMDGRPDSERDLGVNLMRSIFDTLDEQPPDHQRSTGTP